MSLKDEIIEKARENPHATPGQIADEIENNSINSYNVRTILNNSDITPNKNQGQNDASRDLDFDPGTWNIDKLTEGSKEWLWIIHNYPELNREEASYVKKGNPHGYNSRSLRNKIPDWSWSNRKQITNHLFNDGALRDYEPSTQHRNKFITRAHAIEDGKIQLNGEIDADTDEDTVENGDKTTLYYNKYGTVYHLDPECGHLNSNIKTTTLSKAREKEFSVWGCRSCASELNEDSDGPRGVDYRDRRFHATKNQGGKTAVLDGVKQRTNELQREVEELQERISEINDLLESYTDVKNDLENHHSTGRES